MDSDGLCWQIWHYNSQFEFLLMASSGNMYVLPYLFSSSSSSSSLDRPNFKIYKLKYSQHLVENTDSAHSTHSRDSQVINRKLSNSVDTLDDLAQIQITTPNKKKICCRWRWWSLCRTKNIKSFGKTCQVKVVE